MNNKLIIHTSLTDDNEYLLLPYFTIDDNGATRSYTNNSSKPINVYSNILMFNAFFSPNGNNKLQLKPNSYMVCIFNYVHTNNIPYWNITLS